MSFLKSLEDGDISISVPSFYIFLKSFQRLSNLTPKRNFPIDYQNFFMQSINDYLLQTKIIKKYIDFESIHQ